MPNPQITPTEMSERNEWWRNASRLCTLVMCTSYNGRLTAVTASRMATEVCVHAAALRTIASALPDRKSTRLNSSHTEIYTLSLHDALPIYVYFIQRQVDGGHRIADGDGGVCPCGGVEDNRIRFATAGLNTVDEIPFIDRKS